MKLAHSSPLVFKMSGTGSPQPLDAAAYEDRSAVPIAVVTVTLSIATLCVCLRSYARAYLIRQFGPDDWSAVAALVFAMGSGIMVASSTSIPMCPLAQERRRWTY